MKEIIIHPHRFRKVPLCSPIPPGWRMLSQCEAIKWKSSINYMLNQSSIVVLSVGKIDGNRYGNRISPTYGPKCGEKIIISP